MSKHQSRTRREESLVLALPQLQTVAPTRRNFRRAFLKSAQILEKQLERIAVALAADQAFGVEPLGLFAIRSFTRLQRHYYSHALLEMSGDTQGSRYLLEQLFEIGVTLIHLIEAEDDSVVADYLTDGIPEARLLLSAVEDELQRAAEHPGLRQFHRQLTDFLVRFPGDQPSGRPQPGPSLVAMATQSGLGFLYDPARRLRLKVPPASWLAVQIEEPPSAAHFRHLRDAAHLSLHVARALLDYAIETGTFESDLWHEDMGVLFEWFHEACAASTTLPPR